MDLDLGLLIVRLALGPMLIVHGWNKVFGAGGLEGTTGWFRSLGLRSPALQARVAAATEIGAGLLMTLGLLTALSASVFVGLMAVAALTDHRGKGYFVFKGGWEYTLMVAMAAIGVAATGPGAWSLDELLALEVSGSTWAAVSLVAGVAAAGLFLAVCFRPKADRNTTS